MLIATSSSGAFEDGPELYSTPAPPPKGVTAAEVRSSYLQAMAVMQELHRDPARAKNLTQHEDSRQRALALMDRCLADAEALFGTDDMHLVPSPTPPQTPSPLL